MPIPEFSQSINTEYLIMGITAHLQIPRWQLMERASEVITEHLPEEITKDSALIMASLDLAHKIGYRSGGVALAAKVRTAIDESLDVTVNGLGAGVTPPPVRAERLRALAHDLPTPPAVMMGGFRAALRRPTNR